MGVAFLEVPLGQGYLKPLVANICSLGLEVGSGMQPAFVIKGRHELYARGVSLFAHLQTGTWFLGLMGHEYWDEYWECEAPYSWPIGRNSTVSTWLVLLDGYKWA